MPAHLLANAKAYCALIGAICTGLLGVYGPETPVGQVLVVILAVCTAVATFAVPNTPRMRTTRRTVSRNEGGWMLQLVNMDKTGWRIEPTEPGGNTFEMRRDDSGQVDAAYLLKVIVLALVAVLIVAVLFGAVPLDL